MTAIYSLGYSAALEKLGTPNPPKPVTPAPGLLRKYKLPLLAGAALAGLGGYAYLKNRDPMGGNPVQGY